MLALCLCALVSTWAQIRVSEFEPSPGGNLRLRAPVKVASFLGCATACASRQRCRGFCFGKELRQCFLDGPDGTPAPLPWDGLRCREKPRGIGLIKTMYFILLFFT